MSKRVSQEEWDERAAKQRLEWMEPVQGVQVLTRARCQVCGHEWKKNPSAVQQGSGCPECWAARRGKSLRIKQEVWDERAAAVGAEWLEPVLRGSTKHRARCLKCAHEWDVTPEAVAAGGGCPPCGIRSAADTKRKSQQEWNRRAKAAGYTWLEPVAGGHEKTLAKCLECGHEWRATPTRWHKRGCPACGKWKAAAQRAHTADEWDRRAAVANIEWLEPVKGAHTPSPARCLKCGQKSMLIPTRPRCARCGVERSANAKRLSQSEWDRRAREIDIEFLEPLDGATRRERPQRAVRCLRCGHEWEAYLQNLSRGVACPVCAESGFQYEKPAFVYLLVKPEGVAQIGITGEGRAQAARMARHRRNHYSPAAEWHFAVGHDARNVEKETIRRWREEDDLLPAAPEGEEGWTETVHTDSLPLEEVIRRINKLAREQPSYTGQR